MPTGSSDHPSHPQALQDKLGKRCKYTVCVRGTYSAVNNQADRTLDLRPKGQFVALSRRSIMSPSQSPPSIRIAPIYWHQWLSYWSGLLSHPLALQGCSSAMAIAFDYVSEVSITWPWRTDTRGLELRLYLPSQSVNSDRRKLLLAIYPRV